MEQFTMIDYALYFRDLTADQILAYSLIHDRMKSSRRDGRFYDKKKGDFFVIFTAKEMSTYFKGSEHKFRNTINSLVKLGMIESKRQFNRPNKLFIPNFEATDTGISQSKSVKPVEQKKTTNQRTKPNNSIKSTINTINTEKGEKAEKKENRDIPDCKATPLESWIHSVTHKLHLDQTVIDAALFVTKNNRDKAFKLLGIILNAKKNIVNKFNLGANNPITRFEHNLNLSKPLADKIVHVFELAPWKPSENVKYLMTSFKNFFKDAFGLVEFEDATPEMVDEDRQRDRIQAEIDDGPDIPMFKIGTGEPVGPYVQHDWYTEEDDEEDGPDIPIFKIQ